MPKRTRVKSKAAKLKKPAAWRAYEEEIFGFFKETYPNASVQHDVYVEGRYSGAKRQIDILIEDYVAGGRIRVVVDGKLFSRRVSLKHVESFIGLLNDVEAHQGILVTQKGYSTAAEKRAFHDPLDVDLDIVSLAELRRYQGQLAVPYSSKKGVLLSAPIGWVVDIRKTPYSLATMYQRGLTLEQAQKNYEWAYLNFWHKDTDPLSVDELIDIQNAGVRETAPHSTFTRRNSVYRPDAKTRLREISGPEYPVPEVTGYVEFESFIFFCVMFTPLEVKRRNIRKLEYVVASVLPLGIRFDNTKAIEQLKNDLEAASDSTLRAEIAIQIGIRFEQIDMYSEAVDFYKASLTSLRQNYGATKRLLRLSLKMRRMEDAARYTEEFFLLNPSEPAIYNDLTQMYERTKQLQTLRRFFESKLKLNEENDHISGNLHFYLAQIARHDKRGEEAKSALATAETRLRKALPPEHQVFDTITELRRRFLANRPN